MVMVSFILSFIHSFIETGSHMALTDLKLPMLLTMALNFRSSAFSGPESKTRMAMLSYVVLGMEPSAHCMLGKHSTDGATAQLPQAFIVTEQRKSSYML